MVIAVAISGSSTLMSWKRRANAASRSKYFLYSDQVVAAMVRNSPRASAGFSKLAASLPPASPPAPIRVCASSMNRMMGTGDILTSSITCLRRFSNSPLTPAPACSRPRSRIFRLTFSSSSGTLPSTMRSAKPSTRAVLPTPGSPTNMGLFLRRRLRISTICRISLSRPNTGSISPARARAVTSIVNCASAPPSGVAEIAAPGRPTLSFAACDFAEAMLSTEPSVMALNSWRRISWEIPSSCEKCPPGRRSLISSKASNNTPERIRS